MKRGITKFPLQAEVAKWHERKIREGSIDALRKKLKETEKREQEMREKVEKRDRRIEQLHRTEASRTGEFERLRGVVKKLKEANEMHSLQKERANDFSKNWEETNRFLSQRIAELEKVKHFAALINLIPKGETSKLN